MTGYNHKSVFLVPILTMICELTDMGVSASVLKIEAKYKSCREIGMETLGYPVMGRKENR